MKLTFGINGSNKLVPALKSSGCGLDMLGLNVVLVLLLMLRATATDGWTVLFVVIVIYCDAKHSI